MTSMKKDCMNAGQVLRDRWEITGKLGAGGFGQIYKANDKETNIEVVVKVAWRRRIKDTARMILETMVLIGARENRLPNFPVLWGSGEDPKPVAKINYIVMQLLSDNLSDLRRASPTGRLSAGTVMRCLHQAIVGMRDLHQTLGYLHRDVKPSNMAFGASPETKTTLFLIDFGLVRKYVDETGRQIEERTVHVGYRGTARYSSIRVHQRYDQCRGDYLMSVFYSMMESLNGELPWRKVKEAQLIVAKIAAYEEQNYNQFVRYCPEQMKQVLEHIRLLGFYDVPDYPMMLKLIEEYMAEHNLTMTDPYDWHNDFEACREEHAH